MLGYMVGVHDRLSQYVYGSITLCNIKAKMSGKACDILLRLWRDECGLCHLVAVHLEAT